MYHIFLCIICWTSTKRCFYFLSGFQSFEQEVTLICDLPKSDGYSESTKCFFGRIGSFQFFTTKTSVLNIVKQIPKFKGFEHKTYIRTWFD